jgi:dTDP-4-amino-4,6-dideoxygalactose transaminase
MSPLSAAVARVQLRHLNERNQRRNDNCIYLSEKLEKLGIHSFLAPANVTRVYFEFLVRVDEKKIGLPIKDLAKALQAGGAQVGAPRYPLLHQQPMFIDPDKPWAKIARLTPEILGRPLATYDPAALPRTVAGNASLLKLPGFPNVKSGTERRLLDQYAAAFEKVLSHASELPRGSK